MPDREKLIAVLEDARRLLDVFDNDFSWSSWEDRQDALDEVDELLLQLRLGTMPSMGILFAPTGPMQEVSLSSGWENQFIDLANRYDEAMGAGEQCRCLSDPVTRLTNLTDLGMDSRYAEVMLLKCPTCGRHWLRYFYENEGFTGSGRWYHAPVAPAQITAITADNAKCVLEAAEWYFYGGSYFDGRTGEGSGPILIS